MNDKLVTWIYKNLEDRGWSQRELARRTGLSHTTISKILSSQMKVSFDVCAEIARVFNKSPEYLFRLAGLLPGPVNQVNESRIPYLTDPGDATLKEIWLIANNLPAEKRRQAVDFLRYLNHQDENCRNSEPVSANG